MKRRINFKTVAFLAVAQAFSVARGSAAETLAGPFEIIDGDTLRVDGRLVDLVGIKAPVPGARCAVAGKTIDCGRISTTALLDLTAGAGVICELLKPPVGTSAGRARCRAGGYDLSEGMVYTGWAVAQPAETSPYARHERSARARGRGKWRRKR